MFDVYFVRMCDIHEENRKNGSAILSRRRTLPYRKHGGAQNTAPNDILQL